MPIFPHLDLEAKVQVNDRTRFDASKSFITNNETGFSSIQIRPSADEIAYEVYDADVRNRFLDWEYDAMKIDVDTSNNKIDFEESLGEVTATLTSGSYTLSSLATEIQTQLNAAGLLTYVVTVDVNDKLTFSADGNFSLLLHGTNQNVCLTKDLFFELDPNDPDEQLTMKNSFTTGRVESLKRKVTLTAGEDINQISTVTCLANTAAALNNKYFFLWSELDGVKYYVWFNSDTTGTDPAITGATGIEVAVTTGDTATAVATAVNSAIDAEVDFIATSALAVVTVTNAQPGWSSAPKEGLGTGFTFEVTTEGQIQKSESYYISVISEKGDALFTTDADLSAEEADIRKWVPPGRNSFKDVHRRAQEAILADLDREGFINTYGYKYQKRDVKDLNEFKEWSLYMVLRMIFEGIKNSTGDVFKEKKATYEAEEIKARNRAILRIDTNRDGRVDIDEGLDGSSGRIYFR